MARYTGIEASNFAVFKEVGPRTGLPHSHGLAYLTEADIGPGSVSYLLGRLQAGEGGLTWEERGLVVELGRKAITVTTSVQALKEQFPNLTEQEAEQVVQLARRLQVHSCTHHCLVSPPGQMCGQFFPRPPSLLPLLATRPVLQTDAQKAKLVALEEISQQVQGLMRNLPAALQLPPAQDEDPTTSLLSLLRRVADPPVLQAGGSFTWAGVVFPHSQELEHLQEQCALLSNSQDDRALLTVYHCSLLSRRHAKHLPVRSVREGWMVNYNPWMLNMAKSNGEVELVTHTPQKLYSYVTKGATTQTILQMAEEVDSRGGRRMADMAEQLRLAVDEGWKEVSLAESFYRLDPGLHLFHFTCAFERVSLDPFSPAVVLYTIR